MKKSFAPGEIYFVKEVDKDAALGRSKWIKIGLVANDRESLERLGEHQTGNPRRLTLDVDQLVKTELVHVVETKLHREFAHLRVRGEWFELPTDADLQTAITTAQKYAREAADALKVFEKAAALNETSSTNITLEPTPETRAIAVTCKIASNELARIKTLRGEITAKFAVAAEAGLDVDELFDEKIIFKKPKFKPELLKAADAELYGKYVQVIEEMKMSPKFPVNVKLSESESVEALYPDYANEILEIAEIISSTTDPNAALGLADAEASLLRWGGYWFWEYELAKAALQVATGTAKEITGLCTWNRVPKPVTKELFDETTFLLDHPDEYVKYVEKPAGYTVRKVTPRKK